VISNINSGDEDCPFCNQRHSPLVTCLPSPLVFRIGDREVTVHCQPRGSYKPSFFPIVTVKDDTGDSKEDE